jgi:hypothetical protein
MQTINLNVVSLFVRALGAFANFIPDQSEKIAAYTDKAADLLEVAGTTQQAVQHAEETLKSNAEQMQAWVMEGYEPDDDDFGVLIGSIDRVHGLYQAELDKLNAPKG